MKRNINTKLISTLLAAMIAVSTLGAAVSADEVMPVNGETAGSVQDIVDRKGSGDEESGNSLEDELMNNSLPSDPVSTDDDEESIYDDQSRDNLHQGILHDEEEEVEEEVTEEQVTSEDIEPDKDSIDIKTGEIIPLVYVEGTHISAEDSPFLNAGMALSTSTTGYSRYNFTGSDKALYTTLKSKIADVAYGRRTSTEIEVSLSTLGVAGNLTADKLGLAYIYDSDKGGWNPNINTALKNLMPHTKEILYSLLVDCPFEMYWYDKTMGLTPSGYSYGARYDSTLKEYVAYIVATNDSITYSFEVSRDYAYYTSSNGYDYYRVNSTKVNAAKQAAANAQAIVNRYASLSDLEKLSKYKEEICNLVSYDYSAAGGGAYYGDPWQMVYVFDGNSSTNVVCEGYSKAFKYLCDQSTFSGNVNCIIVYGDFVGTSTGGHMWNVVSFGEGSNYLVDVTNCDSGTVGYSDQLFLRNATSVIDTNTYSFSCKNSTVKYIYDTEMSTILYRANALKITTSPLVTAPVITMQRVDTGVKLNWTAVNGASKYRLFRKTNESDWTAIKETQSLTFTDSISISDPTNYTYCVRGISSTGNYLNTLEESASIDDIKAVSITTHPSDVTGFAGNTAKFRVAASGTGLKYQWQTYKSGSWVNSSLTGSTTATLSVDITNSRDGYKFRCVVTNANKEAVASNAATLHVSAPVKITTQPKDYTGIAGSTATFKVVAQGTGLKYQWQTYSSGKWTNSSLSGSKTATLSVEAYSSRDGYKFRCVVTDAGNNTVTSNAVTLNIPAPVSITTQPKDFTGTAGSTATFKVVAQGTGLKYQWQTYSSGKWVNSSLSGAKTATLSVDILQSRDGYCFRCVITDSLNRSVTTNTVKLNVKASVALAIKSQPQNYSGPVGSKATFKVVAQGSGLKYQWQTYSSGKWVNSSLTGAKTSTLTVDITSSRNGYMFRCVVTDSTNKSVTSNTATLYVK